MNALRSESDAGMELSTVPALELFTLACRIRAHAKIADILLRDIAYREVPVPAEQEAAVGHRSPLR